MYSLIKKILFCFSPETAHHIALFCLKYTPSWFYPKIPQQPVDVFGLTFQNPIGLAAGFDKNGDYIDTLGKLGFGFIEVGTITPKPQTGNARPRLFRLPQKKALINRMGFNNLGVDYLVERLKQRKYTGILGVNIGKNATTSIENATDDYVLCLEKVYEHADYITINISSPNTPNLRQLQQADALNNLLSTIADKRLLLKKKWGARKPVLIKISPDESPETLEAIVNAVHKNNIDGIIATNTTLDKTAVQDLPEGKETGGLSGVPLLNASTYVLKTLYHLCEKKITLIGVGGITQKADVEAKFNAGAKLVQVYTGLIYEGPYIVQKLMG